MTSDRGQPRPAAAAPANSPPQWQPLNWCFPFAPSSGNAADPQTWLNALASADGGFYPLGANGMFHGGIHFDTGTGGKLKQGDGAKVIADGEVVAYRLDTVYPELTYPTTPPRYALYSTSFVLVRHKLVLPPIPDKPGSASSSASAASGASTIVASGPPAYQPPADEVLEFYSLYMHQLDWAGYRAAQASGGNQSAWTPRPLPFWQGDRHFVVGSKAQDQQTQPPRFSTPFRFDLDSGGADRTTFGDSAQLESIAAGPSPDSLGALVSQGDRKLRYALPSTGAADSADAPQSAQGVHIHDRAKKGTVIGLLPRGGELIVTGNATSGWAQIAKILSGTPVANVAGGVPDPRASTGWVNLDQLDAVVDPKPLDTVVVLDEPYPVKAGDVVGYLGEYRNSSQSQVMPPKPMRPLLHVEVFTGAQIKDFISKSQDRASKLPDSGKTLLVIQQGAKLVKPSDPQSNDQLAGLTLTLAKGDPGKGCWAMVQPNRLAAQPVAHKKGPAHHSSGTPVGSPLWVERSVAGKVARALEHTWTAFPLQLANAQPVVGYPQVLSRAQLDQVADTSKACDQGTQWWSITAGDADGKTIFGWVCEKAHPDTQWQSPWSWPGFDTVDTTDVPLLDMYRRNLYEAKQLLDGEEEEFSVTAAAVNAGLLIAKLEKAAKRQGGGKGSVVPADLRKALTVPWLAGAVSHLIVRYESEWGDDMSKWETLSSLMGDGKHIWQSELERIRKLRWWEQVKAVKGFPAGPDVWHVHPVGLVGNFYQSPSANAHAISDNGLWFIFAHEAQANVTNHLHWPRGGSGVTLGAGFDMKGRTSGEIVAAMKSIGLSDTTAEAVSHASGLQGDAASTFAITNRNLVNLTDAQQVELLRNTIKHYENVVCGSIKVLLGQNEFDALVSFAYNPAGRWRSVSDFINNGNIDGAMTKIREGNTSGGVVMKGLTNRRADEVSLYINNQYEFNGHPLAHK
jgi:GH24 family phage-related lysozyme (muramidase)